MDKIILTPSVDQRNPYLNNLRHSVSLHGWETKNFSSIRTMKSSVRRHSLVHIHWLPKGFKGPRNLLQFLTFRLDCLYCIRKGAKIIWTAHNLYAHDSLNRPRERRLTRFLLKRIDGLIIHSSSARYLIKSEFGSFPNNCVVIPHGNYINSYPNLYTRSSSRDLLGISPNDIVFLFFGTIRPYKGLDELLKAFRALGSQRANLLIAGDCQCQETREYLIRLSKEDQRIRVALGFVADQDVSLYMNAADVLVLPYRNVLTSGAAVLGMSFSLACVAPRSGTLVDYLDEQPELLYNISGGGNLDLVLDQIVSGRVNCRDIGIRNLKKASSWSWDLVGVQTAKFYDHVAASGA